MMYVEFISTIRSKSSDWLAIRNGSGIFIYSARQGLGIVERDDNNQQHILGQVWLGIEVYEYLG